MASWQSYFTSFVLRHTLKKQLVKYSDDVKRLRAAMGKTMFKVPGHMRITPADVGGVPGEWVDNPQVTTVGTLLYLHGGGYFACSPKTHRAATCYFAEQGFNVYAPDYRLAPENSFPAALEDAQAVTAGLLDELGTTEKLVVAGDSAGGGLALATMLADRDLGRPLPVAALLFSPWTDMAVTGDSIEENRQRCAMFTPEGIRRGAAMYLGEAALTDLQNPHASPLYADLSGLPPLLIHASESETLRDDSTRLAERARDQGVTVHLKLWSAVPHVWQLFHSFVPEGRESLQSASVFARSHLGE